MARIRIRRLCSVVLFILEEKYLFLLLKGKNIDKFHFAVYTLIFDLA